MSSLPRKWKIAYIAFLVVFGIGCVIMEDYLITGFLLSSNIAFLMNPTKSRAQEVGQLVLLSLAFVLGCVHFFLRVRARNQ